MWPDGHPYSAIDDPAEAGKVAIESLRGKTALVTGGARRIGRAVVLELARQGVRVVVHYRRSRAQAEELAQAIEGSGGRAWPVAADLDTPVEAERLFEQALSLAGRIDILINSASVFPADTLRAVEAESFLENVRIHALSPLVLARRFAEAYGRGREGEAGRSTGAIINFLDARITDYDREHAAYHASKLLLFSLTRMMSLEFAPRIRVNAVAPGLILSPPGRDQSYLERLAPTNPLSSVGGLEDITEAVVFLLRSSFVTGQVLFVDGGRHLKGSVYGL
jgi:hypothetical protein